MIFSKRGENPIPFMIQLRCGKVLVPFPRGIHPPVCPPFFPMRGDVCRVFLLTFFQTGEKSEGAVCYTLHKGIILLTRGKDRRRSKYERDEQIVAIAPAFCRWR